MTDIISRLLDEAEKAQRKGHLVLAEVCRDASDKIGLLEHKLEQTNFPTSTDAPDRLLSSVVGVMTEAVDEIERLRAERAELRQLLVGLGAGIPAAAILRAEDRRG